ncbi:MAG: hypothetical protein M1836_000392 [Candelina mexicana]|nr:MAG: hypothetical protein M1836_000392 [Candelina mexicana]
MAASPQLAPAGSSTYNSDTMFVGDGTWDSQRNTFLLPNLVGLNFDTMRYNGMGNRFRELPQYHSLIRGHGIIAAITFLLIVPSAILIARFYGRRPRWALRMHIWLQILTVTLTTVVFVLGWFAVGPNRSLSNPHHGIGLAIYVLVLVQAIGGWWVHGREAGKRRWRIPLKLMFHQWFGRMIALLGLAQIPLGLTLYGSPLALFVLYALAVFILLMIYFVLSYRSTAPINYDNRGSYGSGTEILEGRRSDQHHGDLGALAGAGAAGAGLAALHHHRNRSKSRSRAEVVGSHRRSGSYIEEEKYSDRGRHNEGGNWRDRLFKGGAALGGLALAKNFLDRRRDRDRSRERDRYGAPLGGAHSITNDSVSRLEEGRPMGQHHQPQTLRRRSQSYSSISSRNSYTGGRRAHNHGFRDGVATLGAFGLLKDVFRRRREDKERRRLEDLRQRELEEERIARKNSQRYTGDGFPRRGGRRGSITTTDVSGSTDSAMEPRPRYNPGVPPPIPAGVLPGAAAGAATGAALADSGHHRQPGQSNTMLGVNNPVVSGNVNGPVNMPAAPPDPQGILHQDSGSEAYVSNGGRHHHRHHSGRDAAAAGAAAGLAAGEASRHHHNHRHSNGDGSVASPPVSVKVKMHNDGRHVTLRRLTEQEAALEREQRRKDKHGKHRHRHHQAGSVSDVSGGETWRRTEERERAQAEQMRREENVAGPSNAGGGLIPPPPVPASGTAGIIGGNVGSPGTVTGTYDGTATEASNYEDSRRRRRAERAQARQAAGRTGGGMVDFS